MSVIEPLQKSEPMLGDSTHCQPDVRGVGDHPTGQFSPFPKKNKLKIGECSAFFTYVKANFVKDNPQGAVDVQRNVRLPTRSEDKQRSLCEDVSTSNMRYGNGETWENNSNGEDFPRCFRLPDSTSNDEDVSHRHMNSSNEPHFEVSGLAPHVSYPCYVSEMMNLVMMTSSTHMYPKNQNHLPHCPSHVPGMARLPNYPYSMCVQGHVLTNQQMPNQSSGEAQMSKVVRREAALINFRQKRKERCFDKKIRYVNRKKLAQRRPLVHGQFVRKVTVVTVDLNGDPSPIDLYVEEDDDDRDSSP